MEHPFSLPATNLEDIEASQVLEPVATTLALGEEGGDDPILTTQALGEEGGVDDPIITTLAIGEEGGDDPGVTTLAIGEEGGDDPIVTTLAIGEEGGDDPIVTTLAIGEEGGDFGNDILVSIVIPEDFKARRQSRLDRVLDRVQDIFGDDAVSAVRNGSQDILIKGPLTAKEATRWGRALKRLKRILGSENVLEALNSEIGSGHPFEIPPIADIKVETLGMNHSEPPSLFPAAETEAVVVEPPTLPGL